MLKVSVSGIRGIWGEDLTPESILSFTRAFAQYIKKRNSSDISTIVIGADTRPTSPAFKSMVCAFLQTFGFNVVDLGVCATPVVLFSVRKLKAQGGIVITASHNPLEWNAFKFITHEGLFFNAKQMQELSEYQLQNLSLEFSYQTIGNLQLDNSLIDQYLECILPYFKIEKIKNSRLRLVADVINGTAAQFFPILMQYLGMEYSMIHGETIKAFERGAEPKPENLIALTNKVIERKADIGFAFDPDGDRLALVDENGQIVGENWTLIIAYLCFLKYHSPKNKNIAVNLSTSMLIEEVAKQNQAQVYRTSVGEINVTTMLLEKHLDFGGEGNGGVIFPHLNPCRDSIIAVLFVLEYLALENTRLSTIIKQFKLPFGVNLSMPITETLSNSKTEEHLLQLAQSLNLQNPELDKQDGLRMAYLGGWIQIRGSNTEPIIRIMGESYNASQQEEIVKIVRTWFY